jgi:Arc/MetJ-type ribon-helix-helix transcriptional regulator
MVEERKVILLKVPPELDEEIIRLMNGYYRSRQEYILEAVREKLKHDAEERETAKEASA